MDKIQQYAVKSNTFLSNLGHALPKLLTDGKFVDVTLSCEGHKIKCHRLVLAASSPLFEDLFTDNHCEHPILIMPSEIKTWEMLAVIDFMYKGSVNLSCDGLKDFMRTASILQIRGLYDAPVVGFPDNEPDLDLNYAKSNTSKASAKSSTEADDGLVINEDSLICIPDSPEPSQEATSPFASNNEPFAKNSTREAEDSKSTPSTSADTLPVGKIRVTPNEVLFDNNEAPTASMIPPSLKYNKNAMAISVKAVQKTFEQPAIDDAARDGEDDDCENIVCSPNVSYICSNDEDTGEFNGWASAEIDYDKMIDETYGSNHDMEEDEETDIYSKQTTLVPNTSTPGLPVLVPFSLMNKQLTALNKNGIFMQGNAGELKITDARTTAVSFGTKEMDEEAASKVGSIIQKRIRLNVLAKQAKPKKALSSAEVQEGMELTPNEVILRNPRSNQPRTYGTTALYNALMAVKNGKSIYRASREHQVPRKTLRNWMKRWHIKSQFPMPSQLKDAAIKKRLPKMEKPDDEIQT